MYKKLWADMHSNIHHEQIDQLPIWLEHARQIMDFWPIAYYPFYMRKLDNGFSVEDIYDEDSYLKDWNYIRDICLQANKEGFAMFMGYEWQGNGKDGDHNVYFLDNDQTLRHPMTYRKLKDEYKDVDAIAIPHHVSYQLGSRGKNWDSHDEKFSPFCEIYSSHGLSESDHGPLPMDRHIHMGPRVSSTSYEKGLDKGYKVGCIASGDNHNIPGVYKHGMMCALASSNSKKDIWDALINSRVYGVTGSRIEVDYYLEDYPMGSKIITDKDELEFRLYVKGSDKIDRVEVLKDNQLYRMIIPEEKENIDSTIRLKFKVEFGWGPDVRIFKDLISKNWKAILEVVDGKLLSVEKCFNNYGQKIVRIDDKECEFNLTTYQGNRSDKWMANTLACNEALIFEIEADLNSYIKLSVDDKVYELSVEDILKDSYLFADKQAASKLIEERYGKVEHYRDDPLWHNSYKIKVYQGCLEKDYILDIEDKIKIDKDCNVRLRIHQRNGDIAFVSPIFIRKEGTKDGI